MTYPDLWQNDTAIESVPSPNEGGDLPTWWELHHGVVQFYASMFLVAAVCTAAFLARGVIARAVERNSGASLRFLLRLPYTLAVEIVVLHARARRRLRAFYATIRQAADERLGRE